MTVRQLDIKNRTCYFHNDLINLSNFSVNSLKLDSKTWKDLEFITLVMLRKINLKIGKEIV